MIKVKTYKHSQKEASIPTFDLERVGYWHFSFEGNLMKFQIKLRKFSLNAYEDVELN